MYALGETAIRNTADRTDAKTAASVGLSYADYRDLKIGGGSPPYEAPPTPVVAAPSGGAPWGLIAFGVGGALGLAGLVVALRKKG